MKVLIVLSFCSSYEYFGRRPMLKIDKETETRAAVTCHEKYNSCLKYFVRKTDGVYWAICE